LIPDGPSTTTPRPGVLNATLRCSYSAG
jgi:hypothetical protein